MAEPKQYRVRNWNQFQHYKDRNPPWIKLHFSIFASEDWVSVPDASKLLAIVCMLVASRNEGMVPNNPAYLKRLAYLDRLPDLAPLISCGFLENLQADASAVQADARPETEQSRAEKTVKSGRSATPTTVKQKKTEAYTQDFEAFWLDYPRTPTMSKKLAFVEWRKLDEGSRTACRAALPSFKEWLKAQKPDYTTLHAVRFISQRRFEGFSAISALSDDDWSKRLNFGRKTSQWEFDKWGPPPGAPDCRVPEHLLQPNDGQGWSQWKLQ